MTDILFDQISKYIQCCIIINCGPETRVKTSGGRSTRATQNSQNECYGTTLHIPMLLQYASIVLQYTYLWYCSHTYLWYCIALHSTPIYGTPATHIYCTIIHISMVLQYTYLSYDWPNCSLMHSPIELVVSLTMARVKPATQCGHTIW